MALPPDTRNNPDLSDNNSESAASWADASLRERLRWVRGFRLRVFDAMDELAMLIREEVGKPTHEAITGDLFPLLASCRWHERHAKRILGRRKPIGTPILMLGQRHRIASYPIGHVGIIATWNYPVQLLGVQLLQALVCGNRVTVKPSERSPKTQTMLIELASVGLPSGTLRLYPHDRVAGKRMLESEDFDHVVFTGSTAVGREIATGLASSMTPSTLELSGRDSVFVLDDADPMLAAERIWNTVTMNSGQTCMAPRRVLASSGVFEALCQAIRQIAPTSEREMIDDRSAAEIRQLALNAAAAGAELIPDAKEGSGRSVVPRIALGVQADAELIAGDHFGPLCAVVRCTDVDEMLRFHRTSNQHLASSVFCAQYDSVEQMCCA